MPSRSSRKLVAFFEVRDENGDILSEPTPWAEHLAELEREPLDKCLHPVHNIPHWGQVFPHRGERHLVLARKRPEVSSLDTETREIIDTESEVTRPWVETSVIRFLPGTNKLGFVLGTNASPHVSTLAAWINMHGLLAFNISIVPVLSKKVLQKLSRADEVRLLDVKYEGDQLAAMEDSHGLHSALQALQANEGGIEVGISLKVEKGPFRHEKGPWLLRKTRELVKLGGLKKATATLINYDEDGRERTEEVDFIKHRLARKMYISSTDEEGNPIRLGSAIDAIDKAAKSFHDELFIHR